MVFNLSNSQPEELGLLAAVLGTALAQGRTPGEQNVLGNFLVTVGSVLMTIAAQGEHLNKLEQKKTAETAKNPPPAK